jgi:hypothetical protein
LAGCIAAGASAEGRFVGEVSPAPSVAGARCGAPTRGVLTVREGRFVFAPSEGVLVVDGTAAPDGVLEGRLALHGAAGGAAGSASAPDVLAFSGRVDGDRVEGTLRDARCTAAVSLRRR